MSRKDHFLSEFYEVRVFLNKFLRHPIDEIKNVPDWHWYRLIGVHCVIAAFAGSLQGFVDKKFSASIIVGLFVKPILTLIILAVASLFFYYTFQIFSQKTVSPRRLFTVVMLANIPQLLLQIISGYVPPVYLVGMAFWAVLLLVGFVENFHLDRRLAIRLVGCLYVLFLVLWIWDRVNSAHLEKTWNSERSLAPEVKLGE